MRYNLVSIDDYITECISDLAKTTFVPDPIIHSNLSTISSIVSSAQKRHVHFLRHAMLYFINNNTALFAIADVMKSPKSVLFDLLESIVQEGTSDFRLVSSGFGEDENEYKKGKIDLVVFDPSANRLSSYYVKRGSGHYDADTVRGVRRRLNQNQEILDEFATHSGRSDLTTESWLISYYGMSDEFSAFQHITKKHIDEHFGSGAEKFVDSANNKYGELVSEMIRQKIGRA